MYTVNHKKRDILFLTITLANLNRLRLAKVIVKNEMSRFYGSVCISVYLCHMQNARSIGLWYVVNLASLERSKIWPQNQ